jgi:hypothetical protein
MNKQQALSVESIGWKKYYLFLVFAVVLVFGNTLFNGYNYDDNLVTINHPYTSKGIKAIGKIFTSSYYTNQADISFGYRPMVHLSFALEHQLFGQNPHVSHFFNLLIYLGCVLAFFKVVANWFGEKGLQLAFFAALLFAVHPVHAEAVASIKNRDELLAFWLAMLSFIQINEFVVKQKWWRVALAIALFAIALLSKKSIYPLVFLLPPVLLFIHQQKLRIVLISTVVFSIVVGAVASDLLPNRMFLLMGIPIMFCLLLISWVNRNLLLKPLFNANVKRAVPYALMLVALVFTAATVYYQDYTFFVIALLALAYIMYKNSQLSVVLLFTIFSLLLVGYWLQLHLLNSFALLISALVVMPQLADKKVRIPSIVAISLPIGMLFFRNPNFGVALFVLELSAACYFVEKKNWITSALMFTLAIIASFFSIIYFNVVLILLGLLLILNNWLINKRGYQLKPNVFVMLLLIPILFFPKTMHTQVTNFWAGIQNAEQQIQYQAYQNQSSFNITNSAEGRRLSYVENTLVGTPTKEAKITTGILTLGEYVRLMVWPNELNFYYGFAKLKTGSFADKAVWFWLMVFACIGLVLIWFMRKNTLLLLGVIWFVACLLLFSNWVELVAGMVGERLSFTASAGFCLIIAACILQWAKDKPLSKPLTYFLLVVVLVLSIRTIARNSNWESHLVLMDHDMEQLSESVYANHMYALTCMNEATTNQKLTEPQITKLVTNAEQALKRATIGYPQYLNAQFDLARLYIMQQRFTEAKVHLTNAFELDSSNLFVLEELAKTCFDLNLDGETERYANAYLKQFPQNENLHEILAYTLFKKGDYSKAKQYAERGLISFPSSKNLNLLLVDIEKELTH